MSAPGPAVTGEMLTEAEEQSLLTDDLELAYANMHADWAQEVLFAAVERILADRLAAQRSRLSDPDVIEAVAAKVITEQLILYTLPANYSAPLGRQTHLDVANRCGPLLAAAVRAALTGDAS